MTAKAVVDRAYLDANHPEIVAAIRVEGATAERERIAVVQRILAVHRSLTGRSSRP